ncbi:DUF3883 domain-containing protein [Candidatus Methylomirabilis sp.]|uniref:protein NO VEIN domain-containing protein n=1 Tax=Candidatus Methylomirabilis sp. TaxID=2032687 RepID=UPI003075F753
MSWWIYKCNSTQHERQIAWGDWNDFFFRGRPTGRWGKTEWTPAIAKLRRGDMIIAYQTNRNELVGTAKVKQSCDRDGWLYLERLRTIGVKVRPLKEADAAIAAIPALRPGPVMTVYQISAADAIRLLKAAGTTTVSERPGAGGAFTKTPVTKQSIEDDVSNLLETKRLAAQGFRTNPAIRKAVERYAVRRARRYYEQKGFHVSEHGRPFDLNCQKGRNCLYVEVKGTQSNGGEVILTPNEVDFAQKNRMELFVMHSVQVTLKGKQHVASGGVVRVIKPWRPQRAQLHPLAFTCSIHV